MILLCGATGDLGGRIARRLSAQDIAYRALVRPGSDAGTLEELGAEVVRGDLTDPASLTAAVDGVDVVITTANAIGRLLAGARDVSIAAVDGRGTQNLIAAAEDAGVRRFVYLSMAGMCEELAHRAPLAAAKLAAERRLASASLEPVVVRPDKFQEVWLSPATGLDPEKGTALVYGRGDVPERYVAEDDVAALVVALALEASPPTAVDLGGSERLTRAQVVDAMGEALGRPLRTRHVPRAALRVGSTVLRSAKPEIASLMGMSLYYDTHVGGWDDSPLTSRGITPTSTRAVIDELGRAHRSAAA
jgi:uncharacterized protein YbjT (DUF2867 family)